LYELVYEDDGETSFLVLSHSSDIEYVVDINLKEKTVYCTCPDFTFRKSYLEYGGARLGDKDNYCKHIREVLEDDRFINTKKT
jgi:hypothetical protein